MSDPKCARMLLLASERDLEALRVMRQSGKVSDEVFGFHVHQAVEKSLKPWLALLGEVYPLTHNLELLLDLLDACSVDTKPFPTLIDYTPYAIEYRYADAGTNTVPINREIALVLVESLLQQVRRQLVEVH